MNYSNLPTRLTGIDRVWSRWVIATLSPKCPTPLSKAKRKRTQRTCAGFRPVAAALALLFTGTASAQTPTPTPTPERLKEVVVNDSALSSYTTETSAFATRTETALRDIPASIQVISPQLVQDRTTYSPDQVLQSVSGVTRGAGSEGNYGFANNYLVRGLDVKILRDGIAEGFGRYGNYSRSLVGVDSIEVLKGPGSALYGNGHGGATINFVSKRPLEKPAYEVSSLFGSFDTYGTTLSATGPVTFLDSPAAAPAKSKDTKNFSSTDPTIPAELLYRVDAGYRHSDGFRSLEEQTGEFQGVLEWRPTDDQVFTFRLDYRNIERQADTVGLPFNVLAPGREKPLLNLPYEAELYTPFGNSLTELFRGSLAHEWRINEDLVLRNSLNITNKDFVFTRNRSGVTLAQVGGRTELRGRRLDDQTDNFTTVNWTSEAVQKVETGFVHHTILGGFEFQNVFGTSFNRYANLANISDVYNPIIPERSKQDLLFAFNADRDLNLLTTGLYLQDQMELTEQFKLRLAGRWDHFRIQDRGLYNVAPGGLHTTTLAPNGQSFIPKPAVLRYEDNVDNAEMLTGQAGAAYQPWKQTSFYLGAANGAKAQFDTESLRSANQPETYEQYEIGNKTSLLKDKLSLNVAWFETTRRNFTQTIAGQTVAVGASRSRGLEFDTTYTPVPGWNFTANYAYTEARYAKLGVAADQGRFVAGVPRHQGNLFTTYEFQGGTLKGFGFGGGVTLKDTVWVDQANTQALAGYAVGDLVAYYRQPRYEVQLNVYNVTDEKYYPKSANTAGYQGDPVSFYGQLKYKF